MCLVIQPWMVLANSLLCQGAVCQQPQGLSCRAAPTPNPSVFSLHSCRSPSFPGAKLGICPCWSSSSSWHSTVSCFLGTPAVHLFPQAITWSPPHSCATGKHKSAPHCLLQPLLRTGPHGDSHKTPHTVGMLNHYPLTQSMLLAFYSPRCPLI